MTKAGCQQAAERAVQQGGGTDGWIHGQPEAVETSDPGGPATGGGAAAVTAAAAVALETGDPSGPSTYIQPAGLPADLRPVPSAASSRAASGVAPISASAATVGALAFETGTILQHMPDGRSGRSGRAWQESADREAAEQEAADEAYLDAWKGAADAVVDAEWQESFLRATEGITPDLKYQQSAERLRALIKERHVLFTDMRDDPEKFFLAHRLLARRLVDGFGIRFTVQFNLFAGSILGLGGPEQVARLEQLQDDATLGCFALTERAAGVSSGLVVNTTATWDPTSQTFVLHTPDEDARKVWISQGLTATEMVVVADLVVAGRSLGPHAFLAPLRDAAGALRPGISAGDMGAKTVADQLDNAWLSFDRLALPRAAMLDRFCTMEGDVYAPRGGERMRLEVIGQRLLTGRMCIAQAALVFARTLFANTARYAAAKPVWAPVGAPVLADMPQLKDVFERAEAGLGEVERFCASVEKRLCACLRAGSIPEVGLVEAIAVCKIRGVAAAIEHCHALQQEVGSFALLGGSGFEHMDMLLCCKFAEGDERILMQKMARDKLGDVRKRGYAALAMELFAEAPRRREAVKALQLALAMSSGAGAAPGAAPAGRRDAHAPPGEGVGAGLADEWIPRPTWMAGPGRFGPAGVTAALVSREGAPNAGPPSPEEAKAAQMAAWTRSWREVYALAAAVCDRHMAAARATAAGEGDYAAIGALVMPARL